MLLGDAGSSWCKTFAAGDADAVLDVVDRVVVGDELQCIGDALRQVFGADGRHACPPLRETG